MADDARVRSGEIDKCCSVWDEVDIAVTGKGICASGCGERARAFRALVLSEEVCSVHGALHTSGQYDRDAREGRCRCWYCCHFRGARGEYGFRVGDWWVGANGYLYYILYIDFAFCEQDYPRRHTSPHNRAVSTRMALKCRISPLRLLLTPLTPLRSGVGQGESSRNLLNHMASRHRHHTQTLGMRVGTLSSRLVPDGQLY